MHPSALASRALAALALTVLVAAPMAAQTAPPRYTFELGAAAAYQRFAERTELDPGFGGAARAALFLPLRFSVEGQVDHIRTSTETGRDWQATTYTGALVFNVPLGNRNFLLLKGGGGTTEYDGDGCDASTVILGLGPCGSTGVLLGGIGLRLGLSHSLAVRADATVARGEATIRRPIDIEEQVTITNVGATLGVSFMFGGRPPRDRDGDGVFDGDDQCADTPAGARVGPNGCPLDSDADGVFDGIDRCPDTPRGAGVDARGCPEDSDQDGVPNVTDRCADTPEGAVVDAQGCPRDSDGDSIVDGLDRCSDTPRGATVDALGCPGDEDQDGVLDGIDRCPRTAAGLQVDAFGCPAGETPGAQPPARQQQQQAEPAPAQRTPIPAELESGRWVLDVQFASGSARLQPGSIAVLDRAARVLLDNPSLRVEVAGHTDPTGDPQQNVRLSLLRAEAVRQYLVERGVPPQRLVAQGYGSTRPVAEGTSAAANAQNRRVELIPLE